MVALKLDIGALLQPLRGLSWGSLLGLLGLFVVIALLIKNEIRAAKVASLPGPPRIPIVGHIPYLLKAPWLQFDRWAREYGTIYRYFIWGNPMVVVSEPEEVKKILTTQNKQFPKDDWSYAYFKPILGNGMVTSSGERWKHSREVIKPKFHYDSLERLHPIFIGAAQRVCKRWENKQTVELGLEFRTVTLEVISEVALGLDPEDAHVLPKIFESVLDELNQRMFHPYRAFFPLEIDHRRKIKQLDDMVLEMIRSRRQQISTGDTNKATEGHGLKAASYGGDMLDMILKMDPNMDERQLADELKTMLLAGHETSSMMLLWSCYLLCKNPDKMAKAREEITSVIGSGDKWGTYEQYKSLNYLENVMYEAMRLYAPVPVLTRETSNDVKLGKYDVPKGTTIMLSVWAMHRSPAIWGDDVDCFRPERFSREDAQEKKRHPFSYMPFSLGPRDCIGRNLAIIEAKVVLSSILQRYDMSVAPGQPDEVPTDSYIIPVRPAGGLYMNVKRLHK
eukprot:gb/GECG01014657.1/.p1 GENE.gb/GECG01014657.1/~~gb/GECG01014657.1/.p1  ORF type:complete len:506 (+),score=39.52 gb/GECG01014657.1/:1-1518(+)